MKFTASSGVTVNLSDYHIKRVSESVWRGSRPISKPVEERLFGNINITAVGCWEWNGNKRPDGYGTIYSYVHKMMRAHRMSWLVVNGEIPKDMDVLHKCDNPPCINPDHLWIGTDADKVRDMDKKGRHSKGEQNHHKLSGKQVVAILDMLKNGLRQSECGKRFNVHRSNILKIKRGLTWKHIPRPEAA